MVFRQYKTAKKKKKYLVMLNMDTNDRYIVVEKNKLISKKKIKK